jgi:hypothetical protein
MESCVPMLTLVLFSFPVSLPLFSGDFASISLARIAGGPASNDTALLGLSAAARSSGVCVADAADRWFPTGPCLTHNQVNLLQVRLGEKSVLEGATTLASFVAAFMAQSPPSVEQAYAFLDRIRFTPEELERHVREDVTPEYSVMRYFNELFLPLYFRSKGWETEQKEGQLASELIAVNKRLFEEYRAVYAAKNTKEQQAEDEDNDFSYDQP